MSTTPTIAQSIKREPRYFTDESDEGIDHMLCEPSAPIRIGSGGVAAHAMKVQILRLPAEADAPFCRKQLEVRFHLLT